MSKFFDWLVYSSQDPAKYSLMVKGLLTGGIAYAVALSGMVHVALPTDQLTALVDLLVQVVQWVLVGVSLWATLYGAFRKLYTTLSGTNQVIPPPAL